MREHGSTCHPAALNHPRLRLIPALLQAFIQGGLFGPVRELPATGSDLAKVTLHVSHRAETSTRVCLFPSVFLPPCASYSGETTALDASFIHFLLFPYLIIYLCVNYPSSSRGNVGLLSSSLIVAFLARNSEIG